LDDCLTSAASCSDIEGVKALLASGADVNERDPDGWTALLYAVVQGNLEMARVLLKAGANVNLPAPDGWTPLMKTCLWDRVELVTLLLDYGADLNARTRDGWTAREVAKQRRDSRVLRKLQDADATDSVAER
jgi:ankyrin repeat protein